MTENGLVEGISFGIKELLSQELPEKPMISLLFKAFPLEELKSPTLKRNRSREGTLDMMRMSG
jgi:hypothetical protein